MYTDAEVALTGAVEAVGADDVGVVVAQQAHGARQLGHVEGQVGVGVEDEVTRRRGEAGLDRSTELAVAFVVDDADTLVVRGDLVGDLARGVGRGVVDDDQFVVEDLTRTDEPLTRSAAGIERTLDVLLLVPHRIEDRELGERLEGRSDAPCDRQRHGW